MLPQKSIVIFSLIFSKLGPSLHSKRRIFFVNSGKMERTENEKEGRFIHSNNVVQGGCS